MRRSAALTPLDLWSSSAITANSREEFAAGRQDGARSTATFPPSTPAHPVMVGIVAAASRKRPSGSTPPTGCVTPSSASASNSFAEAGRPGCGWATSRRGEDSRSSGRGKQRPSAFGHVRERPGDDAGQEFRMVGPMAGQKLGPRAGPRAGSKAGPRESRVAGHERKRGTKWAQAKSRRAFRATSGC